MNDNTFCLVAHLLMIVLLKTYAYVKLHTYFFCSEETMM